MKHFLNLWLGLVLIALASALLLLSDLANREGQPDAQALPRIAIKQWTSTSLLDDVVEGMTTALHQKGYVDGRTAEIDYLNALGDSATANMMARKMTGGDYDLILTASTLSLQSVAAANRQTQVTHVFAGVTDPYGAGVGISGPGKEQHPDHMVGIGTFQPVDSAIRIARQMNPTLQRIGVVWSTGEDNSLACVEVARETCSQLGITLVEANANTTMEVSEAVQSILTRDVGAVWIGGDTVAIAAINTIVHAAQNAGVPVFTNDPHDVERGALFGIGASYLEVGHAAGEIAASLLGGAHPNDFGVANHVPEVLRIEETLARSLPDWTVTPEIAAQAAASAKAVAQSNQKRRTREPFQISLVTLVNNTSLDQAIAGVRRGINEAGFVQNQDYILRRFSAQGEVAMLPEIIHAAKATHPDVLVTVTTPALIAAVRDLDEIPVIFTVASDPAELDLFAADNRPGPIAGVHDDPPVDQLLQMAMQADPHLRKVGIVYDAAEPNSLISVRKLRKATDAHAVQLIESTASTPSDLPGATQSLLQQQAGAILLSADNLVTTGFPAIVGQAERAGIPVYVTMSSLIDKGAAGFIGDDYEAWGAQSGAMVARVLAGLPANELPIEPTKVHRRVAPENRKPNPSQAQP